VAFDPERKTKIVCTIGPASLPILQDMLIAGMNVARINCAHGGAEQYSQIVQAVRDAESEMRERVSTSPRQGALPLDGSRHDIAAIAFDIKGPEIRVGRYGETVPPKMVSTTLSDGSVVAVAGQKEIQLEKGDRLTLTTDQALANDGTHECLFVSYPALSGQAEPGQVIYVDDGKVELRVLSTDPEAGTLFVESQTTAPLGERKNVNLPGMAVDLPAVTEKDMVDLQTARDLKASFIFASFVQSAEAVRAIRKHCDPSMRIISKIENQTVRAVGGGC
jgi:pyruvate kinase